MKLETPSIFYQQIADRNAVGSGRDDVVVRVGVSLKEVCVVVPLQAEVNECCET